MVKNVSIDDLLQHALALSGEQRAEKAVTKALKECIAWRSQKRLLDLMNSLGWEHSFDYKAERYRSRSRQI
jgi:hypothetical protein